MESEYKYLAPKKEDVPLNLFDLLGVQENEKSHQILDSLYDLAPKYYRSKSSNHPDFLETAFLSDDIEYKVKVSPTILSSKDGSTKTVLPTSVEESVEDALRSIASRKGFIRSYGGYGVMTSLYEISKELKSRGISMNRSRIKRSIYVLASSTVEITLQGKRAITEDFQSFIKSFKGIDIKNGNATRRGRGSTIYVEFNDHVTRALLDGKFSLYIYLDTAKRPPLERYLIKFLSVYFTNASILTKKNISLKSITTGYGLKSNLAKSKLMLEKVLNSLIDDKYLANYETNKEVNRNNQTEDIIYLLRPGIKLIKNVTIANSILKHARDFGYEETLKSIKSTLKILDD